MKNGDLASEINIIQDVGLHRIYLFWQQILQLIFYYLWRGGRIGSPLFQIQLKIIGSVSQRLFAVL